MTTRGNRAFVRMGEWALALCSCSPLNLAHVVADFAGQFYGRGEYDALCRKLCALAILERGKADGETFRSALDAALRRRDYPAVDWRDARDVHPSS